MGLTRKPNGEVLLQAVGCLGVGILILVSCYIAPTSAQEVSIPEFARVSEGAPWLSVAASATYDSNVARSSSAVAALRGIVPEDEIFSPTIQLNMREPLGGQTLYLQGTAGYDFYQTNAILNGEDVGLAGGVSRDAGICMINLDGNYARRQSSLSDLNIIVSKNLSTDSAIVGGLECDRVGRTSAYFSFSPQWSSNSALILKTSDSQQYLSTAGIAYKTLALGKISAFAQYDWTSFPDRLVATGSSTVADGYNLYGGGIEIQREFGTWVEAIASVSGMTVDSRVPGVSGFTGVLYHAGLVFNPTGRLKAEFTAKRTIEPSDRLDVAYALDEDYIGTVTYQLTGRLKLSVDGRIGNSHFWGGRVLNGADLTRQSIRSIHGTLRYDLSRRFHLSLGATEEQGGADILDYRYRDSRLELQLTAGL